MNFSKFSYKPPRPNPLKINPFCFASSGSIIPLVSIRIGFFILVNFSISILLNVSCAVTIIDASTFDIISSILFSTLIPKTSFEEKYGSKICIFAIKN